MGVSWVMRGQAIELQHNRRPPPHEALARRSLLKQNPTRRGSILAGSACRHAADANNECHQQWLRRKRLPRR